MMTDSGAVVRGHSAIHFVERLCRRNPKPYTPTWATVVEFFDKYLK